MKKKRSLLALLLIIFFTFSGSVLLSGCGGGGGGGGSSSSSSQEIISISGTVTGGNTPINNVIVSLYEIGDNTPLAESSPTNTEGQYTLYASYSNSNSSGSTPEFYVAVLPSTTFINSTLTNGYSLFNLYNGNSVVNINELTTAETAYALNETGGSISNGIITVSNPVNLINNYNTVLSNSDVNNNEINYVADSLAYCVELPNSSCYMTEAFSNSGISYSQSSGDFTLLAVENYGNANIQTAVYGSYNGFYQNSGMQAPFTVTNLTPAPAVNTMNVYLDEFSDESAPNRPYVTIYINNKPFNLLLDTGATGIMINQSALQTSGVNLPQSNFNFSGQFGDGGTYSGYISYANVSTAASGGLTAQNIPIAVATTNPDFPSSGFLQGDFGMGLSPYYSFGYNISSGNTPIYTPSIVNYFPSDYNAGFILQPNNNMSFTNGYSVVNDTEPVWTLIYGLNTESNNAAPSSSGWIFYPNTQGQEQAYPSIQSQFGGQSSDSTGYLFYSLFDTGSNFIYLGTDALDDAVGNSTASTNDVYSCGVFSNLVYGGLPVNFSLYNNANYIPLSFITEPDNSSYNEFCDYTINPATNDAVAYDNTIDYQGSSQGQEDFGLPFMFNQPMYWQAQSQTTNWGVGIEQ